MANLELSGDDLPGAGEGISTYPVTHQGELLGAITLRLPANDPMDPQKERLVTGLASQAGLALRNVRLVEDLRASRRRIVAAQDERAKRLERDIHDGAQQQLVALAVKLRLAEQLAERDPPPRTRSSAELQTRGAATRSRTCATSPAGSTRRCWPTRVCRRRWRDRPARRPCPSSLARTASAATRTRSRPPCTSASWRR